MNDIIINDCRSNYISCHENDDEYVKFNFKHFDTRAGIPIFVCDQYLKFQTNIRSDILRRPITSERSCLGMVRDLRRRPIYMEAFKCDRIMIINSEIIDDSEMLDYVILHELGHLILKHFEIDPIKNGRIRFSVLRELEADIFALMMGADSISVIYKLQPAIALWYIGALKLIREHYLGLLTAKNIRYSVIYYISIALGFTISDRESELELFEFYSKLSNK